ncbi:ABC1 kinase family protein [Caulobacter segnis]|uniref:ABC1 kinase family protein n=1 Tax=Caulobacter segnis TaxID=88688 RepID=UPI001CBAA8A0|nr:AarF/UbiB family protein [Caulobacter segnis]UAL12450.1 phosphotransferase [Caulobacter segnis]
MATTGEAAARLEVSERRAARGRGARFGLDLKRLTRLLLTLARRLLPLALLALVGRRPSAALVGARLRAALQELGLTYVKLGQFMAMRFDILPEAVCQELAQLFDDVAPIPEDQFRRVLETEFGAAPESVFASFDWTPLAAASVAQVHRARLAGGEIVAVKVQRPGVATIFAADMRNLSRLADLVDRMGVVGPQSIRAAVAEFERFTARELDFRTEGRTAERLRANAGPNEYAPRIYWSHSTQRVLTMELIVGHRLSDIIGRGDRPAPPGLDLDLVARNLARACLRQLFVTGFFHADPHPGNIFVRDDGTVCFVDFGIFGQLSDARRETFSAYIESVAIGDLAAAYRHFMRLLIPTDQTDHRRLRTDIEAIFERWRAASANPDTPPADRHLGKYVGEFIGAIRDNKVRMGLDTLLFWRTLIVLDATALRFRESFELLDVMRAFFIEIRPGAAERVLALLGDARPGRAALAICRDGPDHLPRLAGGREAWPLSIHETSHGDAPTKWQIGALILALTTLGAAIAAERLGMTESSVVAGLVALGGATLIVAFQGWRRGHG